MINVHNKINNWETKSIKFDPDKPKKSIPSRILNLYVRKFSNMSINTMNAIVIGEINEKHL